MKTPVPVVTVGLVLLLLGCPQPCPQPSPQPVFDCSDADPTQLERMETQCGEMFSCPEESCHQRVLQTLCKPVTGSGSEPKKE